MSELHPVDAEREESKLVDVFESVFSRAYMLHLNGGDYIRAFEHAELTAVNDPDNSDRYILGRPKLGSRHKEDVMFWLYTYHPNVPPQNYVNGELSMNVRESDPYHLYVLSESTFRVWPDSDTESIVQMLLRSTPAIVER